MQFEHEHHRETWESVREVLQHLFDDELTREEETGSFYVRYGSTVLEIGVLAYGPEESIVRVVAHCVQEVELDEDLLLGLLELNHAVPVGAFSLVGRDIYFSHSLFGRNLHRTALLGSIAAVANLADDYDDRIVDKFGGVRALDLLRPASTDEDVAAPSAR